MKLGLLELGRVDSEAWLYMRSDIFFVGQTLCARFGNSLHEMFLVGYIYTPSIEEGYII